MLFPSDDINRQPDQHADSRGAESVLPTVNFAECAGDERGYNDTGVDEDIINLKRVRAAVVAGCVQCADLAGEISFETTDPNEQTRQCDEERDVESCEELASCPQKRAEHARASEMEHAISQI